MPVAQDNSSKGKHGSSNPGSPTNIFKADLENAPGWEEGPGTLEQREQKKCLHQSWHSEQGARTGQQAGPWDPADREAAPSRSTPPSTGTLSTVHPAPQKHLPSLPTYKTPEGMEDGGSVEGNQVRQRSGTHIGTIQCCGSNEPIGTHRSRPVNTVSLETE